MDLPELITRLINDEEYTCVPIYLDNSASARGRRFLIMGIEERMNGRNRWQELKDRGGDIDACLLECDPDVPYEYFCAEVGRDEFWP